MSLTHPKQDVINFGTAVKAKQLGRTDLAGKTGTTSNYIDAWFCDYQKNLVTISWMGYDEPKSLGSNETGGRVALPIWMDYMKSVMKDVPMVDYKAPSGITATKINSGTGFRDSSGNMTEYFFSEQLPPVYEPPPIEHAPNPGVREEKDVRDQLF